MRASQSDAGFEDDGVQGHVAPVAWLQLGFLGTARAGAVKAEGAGARCDIGEVRDGGFAELSRRRGER